MRIINLFFLLFSVITVYSQKQANVWCFGVNAGIDFNFSTPKAFTNSKLIASEGCAAISDTSGKLLFYTDGLIVWNSAHNIMPNGTGLLGGTSSTQSAIIIPRPGCDSIYYVFTTNDLQGGGDGFRYSTVDMKLQNGLGDVVPSSKNTFLFTKSSEKVTAAFHPNHTDIWVVAHEYGTNAFYAYLVTFTGITTTLKSNSGTIYSAYNIGQMKFSPDGKKIASIIDQVGVEVFDFDGLTGQVSNPMLLTPPGTVNLYGVSFSPDNTKLYMTSYFELYQYDLSAGSQAAIQASRTTIFSTFSNNTGALQLATNGKLYMKSLANYTAVINFPDQAGILCNYQDSGVYLGGKTASWGLPAFIESYFDPNFQPPNSSSFNPVVELGNDTTLCKDSTITLTSNQSGNYLWNNASTGLSYKVSSAGIYWLKVTNSCGFGIDSVKIDYKDCSSMLIEIPNVFTPNGDNKNDLFKVKGIENQICKLEIYNRWGIKVYENDYYKNDWDAYGLTDGTYYYCLQPQKINQNYSGFFQLIR